MLGLGIKLGLGFMLSLGIKLGLGLMLGETFNVRMMAGKVIWVFLLVIFR